MSRESTIFSVKIVSTVGLGLVASLLPLLPARTLPAIQAASSPAAAVKLLSIPRRRQVLATGTSITASIALCAAYYFSPSHGRHPYLLYASAIGLVVGAQSSISILPRIDEISEHADDLNGETMTIDLEQLHTATSINSILAIAMMTRYLAS